MSECNIPQRHPKPTCLEVFMVFIAWFLGGQNLYFSWFWGLMEEVSTVDGESGNPVETWRSRVG